jgi:hypothetical protein
LTSCSQGQIKEEKGLLDNLKYTKSKLDYSINVENLYPVEILINGFPIHTVTTRVGGSYLDLGIEKKGTQKIKIILDLSTILIKDYQPKPNDKILSLEIMEENITDEFYLKNSLKEFELNYSDLKDEDIKRGFLIKEIEFKATIKGNIFKEDSLQDLRTQNQQNLLKQVYDEYKSIIDIVEKKDAVSFVEKFKITEYQSSQLRNAKKEWIIKEREKLFKNTFHLLPIDSCKLVFTEDGKRVTLGRKYNIFYNKPKPILNFPALSGEWEKGSFPKFVTYYHYFYFSITQKNKIELLRHRTFTYDMDM